MWTEDNLERERFEKDELEIIMIFPDRIFLKHKSKMTGDYCVFKFLRCSDDGAWIWTDVQQPRSQSLSSYPPPIPPGVSEESVRWETVETRLDIENFFCFQGTVWKSYDFNQI